MSKAAGLELGSLCKDLSTGPGLTHMKECRRLGGLLWKESYKRSSILLNDTLFTGHLLVL